MKVFITIVKIVVILALIAVITVMMFVHPASEVFAEGVVFDKNTIPLMYSDGGMDFVDPHNLPTDQEDLIALAARMYDVANKNTKRLDKCAFLISYNSNIKGNILISFEIPVFGYRYQLKNGTEYWGTEYSIPQGNAEQAASMFAKENSMFALRSYTDVSKMDYLYSLKSYKPTLVRDEETGVISIESDFSDKNLVPQKKWKIEQKTPVFSSTQEEPYYAAGRPMTTNNIKTASIEYKRSKEGNYYVIVVELDTDEKETWENTIEELRSGAGDDARYDKMTETLEIWENGYYKRFKSEDYCSAWYDAGGKPHMEFIFNFDTNFFYEDKYTDPDVYDNFAEAKADALAYHAAR